MTAAIKGAGAILSVSTASSTASTITAITQASPGVVTVTNSFTTGEIVTASGIVGMTQLNGRAFVVSPVTGTSATLKGVNTTNYSAYTSGGLLTGQTMTLVGQVMKIKGFQGQPAEIDITNLQSNAKEFLLGLQDFGTLDITLLLASGATDAGQLQLRAIKEQQILTPFSLQLADGTVAAFMAFVKQFGIEGVEPEGAVTSPVVLRVSNGISWFA